MAPHQSLQLADDQRFALMKLRRSVQDVIQPHHNDEFLVRWLRARKWDPTSAEKMLRESLEWRKRWGADKTDEYEVPKVARDFLPHGVCGFDKQGAPVIVVPFGGLDMYGMLHVISRREFVRVIVKTLEDYLKICQQQREIHGPDAAQCTVIFDMENFNLRQYMWKPAGELILALIQMYEANYPEILKIGYIINAPKVFAFAYSIVKKFMNEYTIAKIQIYKADPAKWKQVLLNAIPADQLPAHYGGTAKDEDGNPKLASKICQGGKIPKSMYTNKWDKVKGDEFTTVTVKKGDKLKLDFTPKEIGEILSWEFRTDEHDIKFGVVRKTTDGTKTDIIPVHRVSAHQRDEVGICTCDTQATYTLVFDNSYSLLRNKKVKYCVKFLPGTKTDNEVEVAKS